MRKRIEREPTHALGRIVAAPSTHERVGEFMNRQRDDNGGDPYERKHRRLKKKVDQHSLRDVNLRTDGFELAVKIFVATFKMLDARER